MTCAGVPPRWGTDTYIRWELTVNHWDEDLVELDVTREPLSVYYPLDAPAKKK